MDVKDGEPDHVGTETQKAPRPMKVVVAEDGSTWLCDADVDVDPSKDLGEQGCWRCSEAALKRDD